MKKKSCRIAVREYSSTYIARGGGKTASCTMGRRAAAETLARKLFGLERGHVCMSLVPSNAPAEARDSRRLGPDVGTEGI